MGGFLADEPGRQESCQSVAEMLLDLGVDRGLAARPTRPRGAAELLDQHPRRLVDRVGYRWQQ